MILLFLIAIISLYLMVGVYICGVVDADEPGIIFLVLALWPLFLIAMLFISVFDLGRWL